MDDEDNDALAETVVPQRRGQLVKEEERQGVIEFRNVVNDGKRDSMIMLTGKLFVSRVHVLWRVRYDITSNRLTQAAKTSTRSSCPRCHASTLHDSSTTATTHPWPS